MPIGDCCQYVVTVCDKTSTPDTIKLHYWLLSYLLEYGN